MLIQLQNVTKTYGPVTALRDLNLELQPGALGLLGPNGAGKTTMIRTLLGLIRIDQGQGTVFGKDIRHDQLAIRQLVGFVPEDECLFPGMQGVEFVAYAGELCGMPGHDSLQRAHEVLDYVGLGEARYRQVESYSTGMKQRLKIASAIIHDPKLVILDEPTNGMDPDGREEILELAQDMHRQKGMSLLFSSHLLPDVESVCDYIVVMGRGTVLAKGKLAELKLSSGKVYDVRTKENEPRFADALLRGHCQVKQSSEDWTVVLPPEADARLIWEIARREQVQIRCLRARQKSLEEIFLDALGA